MSDSLLCAERARCIIASDTYIMEYIYYMPNLMTELSQNIKPNGC